MPMNDYPQRIEKLNRDVLEDVKYGTNLIEGKAHIDRQKILCLAIPYSNGWKGMIDGVFTDVFLVNNHYLGVLVDAGDHDISFKYDTPYLKAGEILSLIGIIAFLLLMIIERQLEKNQIRK